MSAAKFSKVTVIEGNGDFALFYSNIRVDNEGSRRQIEADAREDAPEWGVDKYKIEWTDAPVAVGA
jgi:hypothetical protein